MTNFNKSDFEVQFAEHSVFDGKRYAEFLQSLNICQKREILPKIDNEKVFQLDQHRLNVLTCEYDAMFSVRIDENGINNEKPFDFVLKSNDTFVIPACNWPIIVKCDKKCSLSAFSLLETMECYRFMNSKFRLYWPILGTKRYFESIHQNVWIHDVYEHTDFLDKFIFTNLENDAPIFKFLRKHLDYTTITYSPLSLYVELSKWRSFPKNVSIDDNTDSDVKVVLYSEKVELLNHLSRDNEFKEYLQFPLNDAINLTTPRCIEFHVLHDRWENCKNFLKTHYNALLKDCVITQKGNQLLETQQIETSACIHTKEVQFALNEFKENKFIYPVLCEPGEVPNEYKWCKKVWDLMFIYTTGYEHIKI